MHFAPSNFWLQSQRLVQTYLTTWRFTHSLSICVSDPPATQKCCCLLVQPSLDAMTCHCWMLTLNPVLSQVPSPHVQNAFSEMTQMTMPALSLCASGSLTSRLHTPCAHPSLYETNGQNVLGGLSCLDSHGVPVCCLVVFLNHSFVLQVPSPLPWAWTSGRMCTASA